MAVLYKEVRVFVENLELGMHVVRLDKSWEESDFLLQGFIIQNGDDIHALRQQCDHVFIEAKLESDAQYLGNSSPMPNDRRKDSQGLFARGGIGTKEQAQAIGGAIKNKRKQARPSPKQRVTYINKINTEKEIGTARHAYHDAKASVKSIMDGMRIGKTLDMHSAKREVSAIVDSVLRNKDALAWLTKIKDKDDYTAEHSLNVCILTATFARHLGHSEFEIRRVALCGLLHDVGKSKIPTEILNKEGRFTDDEFETMKMHTSYGRDLLIALPNADRMAVDVAHAHHERMDGSGYPRGLTETQIPYYAKVVALADCYDAITSTRCYDSARSSMDALDIIYKCKGVQFDEELALEFIKCVGVYPPGAIVECTNGEVGIVLSTDESNKLRPRVLIVLSTSKEERQQKVIDLSKLEKDDKAETYQISKELPNGSFGVDLKDFLARGLVIEQAEAETGEAALAAFPFSKR